MKKFRPLALLSLFLCAVMLLASCGGGKSGGTDVKSLSFKQVVNKSTAKEPVAATMEEVTLDGSVQNNNGVLVLLSKPTTNISVYNLALNQVVFKTTRLLVSTSVNLYAPDGRTPYFTVQVTDTTDTRMPQKTTLYDASGKEIASVDELETAVRNFDVVFFGKKAYRLGDDSATGTLTEITAYSPLKTPLPTIRAATKDYYYCFDVGQGPVKNVHIYNKDLSLVSVYSPEGNPNNTAYMVLDNGKIIYQASYKVLDTDENATYFNGTNKYLLKTVLVDPKTGKAKTIDFDFLLTTGVSIGLDIGQGIDEDDGSINKKIRNIAFVSPIVDGWLLSASTDMMLIALENSGKIIGRIDAMVTNQYAGGLVDEIRSGYFTIPLANNGVLLLNEKGKEIGEISGADDTTYSYIIAGGALYGYDLKEVYNYEAEGYTLVRSFEHSVILTKDNDSGDTEYFRYDGTLTPLITGSATVNVTFGTLGTGIYTLTDNSNPSAVSVKYYNDKGELILTLDRMIALSLVTFNDDFALYSGLDASTSSSVYYRVTR